MGYIDLYESKSLCKAFIYYVHFVTKNPNVAIKKVAKGLGVSVPAAHAKLYALVKMGYLRKEKSTKPQAFTIDWDYITNDFLNVFLNGAPFTKKDKNNNNKISLTKKQFEALKSIVYHHILCIADANLTEEEYNFQEKYEELSFGGSFVNKTFEHLITDFFKDMMIYAQLPRYQKIKEIKTLKPVIKKLLAQHNEGDLVVTLEGFVVMKAIKKG